MKAQHYWNKANFEGLAVLASALRDDPRMEHLARYCELREAGVRSRAFAELERFLREADHWEVADRRDVALRVLEAHRKSPEVHQFLSDPLRRCFVEPVLEAWRTSEPENAAPVRQLALLRRERQLLDEALRLDPQDDEVRVAIATLLLQYVDVATHHLCEGVFIGDEAEAHAALEEARSVLRAAVDCGKVSQLRHEVEDFAALLADWSEYVKAPQQTFPDWCRQRGHQHRWYTIVYYDDGTA